MNTAKKLISTVLAGATLAFAAPVFADSYRHDRGYDRGRHVEHYRHYDRHGYRGHGRHVHRGYAPRAVIVERPYYVQRPIVVEQPVYYSQPQQNMGLGAMIGAAIGTVFDNHQ